MSGPLLAPIPPTTTSSAIVRIMRRIRLMTCQTTVTMTPTAAPAIRRRSGAVLATVVICSTRCIWLVSADGRVCSYSASQLEVALDKVLSHNSRWTVLLGDARR